MQPAFASSEWLEALAARLARSGAVPEGEAVWLRQVVTDLPEGGATSWVVVLEPGAAPRVEPGGTEGADITLVASYGSLAELASRKKTAAELLADGEMKIEGDVAKLLGAAGLLEALSAALAGLGA